MAQNDLNVNILANVKGAEQLATLINRVGALEKETQRLKSANSGLANSTDAVIRNGVRYNNALDAQSKQLRNARQGTQQLGMQINDFATSVSTGASVSQAFNQQLGQLGYAMSMMGGTAGRVGAFLAGPWGAAVTIAVSVLGPMIERLFSSSDAADKAADSYKGAADEARGLAGALNALALTKAKIERNKAWESLTKKELLLSGGRRMKGSGGDTIYAQDDIFGLRGQSAAQLQKEIYAGRLELARQESLIRIAEGINASSGATTSSGRSARTSGGSGRASSGGSNAAAAQAERLRKSNQEWQDKIAKEKSSFWEKQEEALTDAAWAEAERRNSGLLTITQKYAELTNNEITKPLAELQQSYEAVGNSVADAFKGMLTGAMSWKDGMKSIIGSVISELWRLYVVQQIVGLISSGLKAIGLPLPKVPGNANGTQNWGGGMTWVGERGPELVNLPRGSQVIPAHRAQNMSSGGVTVNVDARGSADPAAVRAQVQQGILEAAPAIIAAAESRTVAGLRRPRLGGAVK